MYSIQIYLKIYRKQSLKQSCLVRASTKVRGEAVRHAGLSGEAEWRGGSRGARAGRGASPLQGVWPSSSPFCVSGTDERRKGMWRCESGDREEEERGSDTGAGNQRRPERLGVPGASLPARGLARRSVLGKPRQLLSLRMDCNIWPTQ